MGVECIIYPTVQIGKRVVEYKRGKSDRGGLLCHDSTWVQEKKCFCLLGTCCNLVYTSRVSRKNQDEEEQICIP